MTKFCPKCGKALPEDAETCPDCGVAPREDGAALFTRISAETEGWQEQPKKKEKKKRTRSQKQMLAYTAAAIAAMGLAVFLILYIQPVNRVIRAIGSGDYERAMDLYWGNTSLAAGEQDAQLSAPLRAAAERVRAAFSAHELSAEEAATQLAMLGTFGDGAEALLADTYAEFRELAESREHMEKAALLARNGDYLAAREEYLLVSEADSDRAEAVEKADDCLERYAEGILSDADVFIQTGDYSSAVEVLEAGRRTLLGYDVYHEKLDYKLTSTYALLEEKLLRDAAALAGEEDFAAAAALLTESMTRLDFETERLRAAAADYTAQARGRTAAQAAQEADRLYGEGKYEDAFTHLEQVREMPEADPQTIDAAIAALEERFTADSIAAADAAFGWDREKLPEAVTLLTDALRVRRLEAIEAHREELSRYLPASLAEIEYDTDSKNGTIFRSASVFEGLDGVNYEDGWIWGENDASLTFVLDGNYDLLTGDIAIRREDDAAVSAHLEIEADGQEIYRSDTLSHPDGETIAVSVDISGCERLTLRFVNDYAIMGTTNNFCYHGFCSPTVTKNLPRAGTE